MSVDNDEVRTRSSAFIVAVCLSLTFFNACSKKPPAKQQTQQTGKEPAQPAKPPVIPSPAPETPAAADTRPIVSTFGDSLTQGVSGKSYPAFLQDLLDENGYAYRVENQGVSGDTTVDGLARLDNVVAEKPALVVLEFGGNDGLRGIPVESTKQNLEEMIRRLQAANIPLVLAGITLPPNYGQDYVAPFTAMFPELATKYHLRLIPFLLVNVYNKAALMQPDGIHPNENGNRIVAADVFKLIRPVLKRG